MSYLTPIIRRVYRRALPSSIRECPSVLKLKQLILEQVLGHNAIYDLDYYADTVEGPAIRSAGVISESIILDLKPRTVVDVGCGTGALLEALRQKGCHVLGFEYSEDALKYCRRRELDVLKFDLEKETLKDDRTFDVTISMEVAEHLPERIADRYVDLLTCLSSIIVFTAAHPGQGGTDHVNEQPASYWISKFQARAFNYDVQMSTRWRNSWKATGVVARWYYENLMIFRRIQGNYVKRTARSAAA